MMANCPKCGSAEIVSDLSLFASAEGDVKPVFVTLVDPSQKGEDVTVGFRADICGSCGYSELHTRFAKDVLNAHKKGYVTYKL
jgi:predicted nucleic-acid-binding Zn-ribbon protein